MRIALIGDFDAFLFRGLERPSHLGPYRLSPGLNLARGFRELGVKDVHYFVGTPDVTRATVEEGPFGWLHRLPRPRFSGSASFHLWRRHIILRELQQFQPDIVHGQGTEAEYAFTAVTSSYRNVITFHGIMHRVYDVVPSPLISLSHVPRWLEKLVARRARHVICISSEVERFLRERHSRALLYRIPNAIAPCFFDCTATALSDEVPVIAFVGTVYPLKGVIYLVEALARVREQLGRPVRLRVIGPSSGNGEYHKLVRRKAQELQLDKYIEWCGAQNESAVAASLAQSQLLALPSFQENAPMCIAEAMGLGVPVVASNVGGIPDIVQHGVTGLLIAPGDSRTLADALLALLSNPERRRVMGAAARDKALAEYAPRVVAAKTLDVYRQICQGQP